MGSGTKCAADDSISTTSPRGSKARKTSDSKTNGKKAANKSLASQFKSKALPLHVNLTHTPPSILKKVESDVAVTGSPEPEEVIKFDAAVAGNDTGFIENLTLLPSSFTTGSYGWNGSKHITVELQGGDGNSEGGKEKVINATVIGSKPSGKKGKGNEVKKPEEDLAEEPEADEKDDE